MTSDVAFPSRFTKIDGLTRPDHYWLVEDDRCFFLGEYTARHGYAYSPTNNLILNFKKTLDRRDRPEWRYKGAAIQQTATAFRGALGASPPPWTFVPVPPSRAADDPLYDGRVKQMLLAVWLAQAADVREIIVQPTSTKPAHETAGNRPDPQQIEAGYRINESVANPPPASIAIVDDVLTTGAHFRAASTVLAERFPTAQIVGLFIARRVPDADSAV